MRFSLGMGMGISIMAQSVMPSLAVSASTRVRAHATKQDYSVAASEQQTATQSCFVRVTRKILGTHHDDTRQQGQ
jgi:hypothetical protein